VKGQRPGVLPALAFAAHYPLDTGFTKRLFHLTFHLQMNVALPVQ